MILCGGSMLISRRERSTSGRANRRVSYTFTGLRHNLDSIKSKARVLIAWIDEAENVSEIAYQNPSLRACTQRSALSVS